MLPILAERRRPIGWEMTTVCVRSMDTSEVRVSGESLASPNHPTDHTDQLEITYTAYIPPFPIRTVLNR